MNDETVFAVRKASRTHLGGRRAIIRRIVTNRYLDLTISDVKKYGRADSSSNFSPDSASRRAMK